MLMAVLRFLSSGGAMIKLLLPSDLCCILRNQPSEFLMLEQRLLLRVLVLGVRSEDGDLLALLGEGRGLRLRLQEMQGLAILLCTIQRINIY